jgi:glutaminyl-peptide cyclotransferase
MNSPETHFSPPRHPSPRQIAALVLATLVTLAAPLASAEQPADDSPADRFEGQRAYSYLKQICKLGNRMSGSDGMRLQQELLVKHFTGLGAQVDYQRFQMTRHPLTDKLVPMANLIVQWRPQATERILLCAHYDSRPRPDREPNPRLRRSGEFLGANDGASGAAVLMEMGHHVKNLPEGYGLDFVFFDAEEFVFSRRDKYFLGSEWFARNYVNQPPKHRYLAGVLLDMVGDAKLSIYQEKHSATWPDTRPLVQEIWDTAARLGVKEFIPRVGYEVLDDHVPLRNIAKIPVIDVIDFQYPDRTNRYWHTTADTPNRCSAASLGKVGWVLQEWLATKR